MRLFLVAVMVVVSGSVFAQQQTDPAKLLAPLQAQRDTANNQVAVCAAQNADLQERVKQLEAEVAKLSPKKD